MEINIDIIDKYSLHMNVFKISRDMGYINKIFKHTGKYI